MKIVVVTGGFDDLRSKHVRFLEQAAMFGSVHVALWSDKTLGIISGSPPKFPERERHYLLKSLRFVDSVTMVNEAVSADTLPELDGIKSDLWAVGAENDTAGKRADAEAHGIPYGVIGNENLIGWQVPPMVPPAPDSSRRRVLVTGSYDWLHSGHVRFFEEACALGDLYVVVGHDANIKLLKGEGHPLLPQAERLYMVRAVRYVHQATISTGHGWLDAEPEIALIKPDYYVVNEDGDKPEKRAFCAGLGIEYVVLKRIPKQGLPKRLSTALRGF